MIILWGYLKEKLRPASIVREQLILQFRSQTIAFGFSKEGITMNPPQYDENVFNRRFLGSLK